jgi:hypothetical protein
LRPALTTATKIISSLSCPGSNSTANRSFSGRYSTRCTPRKAATSAQTASGQPVQVKPPRCIIPLTRNKIFDIFNPQLFFRFVILMQQSVKTRRADNFFLTGPLQFKNHFPARLAASGAFGRGKEFFF